MGSNTLRGKAAVVGVGETTYYKHGKAPESEFKLTLRAILAAAEDAGVHPREIDGFSSFSDDRNNPSRIAAAMGCEELRYSNMVWGGGGGGAAAAIGNAAAAIVSGQAECVVAYRGLAQGQFVRFGSVGALANTVSGDIPSVPIASLSTPYGIMSPAQNYAMRVTRFLHEHNIERGVLRSISRASYHHAQANPRAVMHGRPLTDEAYDNARWIVEPFRLYDCCMENDGAAALILMSAERAADMKAKPVYLLASCQGSDHRNAARAHNAPHYGTSSFSRMAPRLYEMAGIGPKDIDVVQAYENFTGGVLMSLFEHGLFKAEEANEFFRLENLIAPGGCMPLNTSGGHLAECYMHGLGLAIEAVRQVRGDSTSQVTGAQISLFVGGPMVTPASNAIFGSKETL